jgi:16S rRNA C967 or C1407 C5-methylase (RsmB/RsmF family)
MFPAQEIMFPIDQWLNRRTYADIERNAKMQREILAAAVKCLATNGEIVYSTCSLEPEEDELNMDWAVKNLGLKIQDVDCIGEAGLTQVLAEALIPKWQNASGFGQG